jgi:RHS repeat-associated protein
MQYGGAIVDFAPNVFGLPTKVADSTSYASQIQYYADGQLKTFTYGNGLKFSQLLNAEFKPYERAVQKGTVNRYSQRYQYDQSNNVTTITDLMQSSQSVAMSYDGLDRLKTASGFWGAGVFDYDETGNILAKQLGNQKLLYSYDGTTKRLNSVTGGYTFSYDDRSNVIHNGKLGFYYNRANQLINGAGQSYSYDGHGRRVSKSSASATAYSVYNQAGKLLMTDGANGLVRYIYLGNDQIAKVGSSLALEDKPGYTGHVEDKALGLTYMQQRYYDPVIGRFYSNDPIGGFEHLKGTNGTHGFNRYAYANNNPYKFTDPDGRSSYNPQGLSQNISDFNKVRIEHGISNTEALGDITGVNDVVDATKALANGDIGGALLSAAAVLAKPLKAVKMQQKVEKGQAPKGIERFDKAEKSVPDSKDHVHFKDGTSMNNDGSVHDKKNGIPNPNNTEKKFLEKNGWPTEVKK